MEKRFTKAIDLLYLAKKNGVDILLHEEQLQLKLPKNKKIDNSLLEEVKHNKKLLIDFLKSRKKETRKNSEITRSKRETGQKLPLSFSQERLWFIDQMEGSVQYHIPAVLRLKGNLNQQALGRALKYIVERHEVLRSVFQQEEGQPYQSIRDATEWQLEIIDGSIYSQDHERFQSDILKSVSTPFDLSKDFMVRAMLIRLAEQEHVLVVNMHHIASDGWSTSIIVKEVVELYASFVEGREPNLLPLTIQYSDFAIWQRKYLQGEVLNNKMDYWKQKLSGVSPLQLPTDHPRPALRSTRGASIDFSFDKLLSGQLHALCQQQGTTLYMTMLAALNVLLHNYTGQDDICIGSPIANRTQHEVEALIGFFVNTLALRSEIRDEVPFTDFLQQVRETTMSAYEHQEMPFEKVVELVVKERDMSRTPLFQVMLVLQNTPEAKKLKLGEIELSGEQLPHDTSKFEITLFIVETPQGLQGSVEYSTDLFSESTIKRMLDHFKILLNSIVTAPGKKIGELKMLTPHEEQQLLFDFNNTDADYPKDKSLVGLFEEQVTRTPGATAVVFEHQQLTYRQLNEKANQLAAYLRTKGVREESLVPVCIERSLEMIIGILGILKAGAAYVPIDPEYPAERISYMLEDTQSMVVISSYESRNKLFVSEKVEVIELDRDWKLICNHPVENIQTQIKPHHLAYVIYTSGSTGKPKGVKMAAGGLVNLLLWQEKQFKNKNRRVLQFASLNFDVSFQEIFSTICFGSSLFLISGDTRRDTPKMISDLEKQGITHLFIPYIVLKNVVEYILSLSHVSLVLQEIIVAGEQLKITDDIRDYIQKSGVRLINQYGPTEAHVVTSYSIDNVSVSSPLPPIGKPVDNTKIYILNTLQALLPIGVAGELCIGGIQVARGYLNREELTAAKFIPDYFTGEKEARIYRTGDSARWLPDGNIEYLGRIDDQVKIRGYRIELGEIETTLHQHEGVRQAIVLAREDSTGNKRLVAYVTPEGIFDKESIIQFLKDRLPDYMIPGLWVEMANLPVTANGKVDRKALPDPDASELLTNKYLAPRSDTEKKLAAIWKELLGVEQVGVHDNFFELGGHSLMAIRVISAIRKQMEIELSIHDLFTHTSVAELATHLVTQSRGQLLPSVEAGTRPEFIPLSFSQERLWFIDRLEGSVQYHLPAVLRLTGSLDKTALQYSLQTVVNRHEVLRTVIREHEGKAWQHVKQKDSFQLSLVDGHHYKPGSASLKHYVSTLVNEDFDLAQDDMIRGTLITIDETQNILVLTMHHIASDGWSISILVKEVLEIYASFIEERTAVLPTLQVQYADYALWQRKNLQGELLEKKLNYWKQKLNEVSPLQLPTDHPRPPLQSRIGVMIELDIDKQLTGLLQDLSNKQGATLFMTLMAAFNVLLHRYSGQQDICVGTPSAGRQQEQLENLIGFFINTLAIRNEVNSNEPFTELLKRVRQTTLEAFQHQEVPFEKIVEAVVKERDMSRSPLFQVMFVYQNTPEIPQLRLGELLLSKEDHTYTTSQFDISFIITETSKGLQGSVNYCSDLFNQATMRRMISHFKELLQSIVTAPQKNVGSLAMLTIAETNELKGFNPAIVPYPANSNIIHLFEEQAAKIPDEIALILDETELTYKELNEQSNQLARYLQTKGVAIGSLVPICVERSQEMVIGMLGILKAGAAYVPVDPAYPPDRIHFMLEDSRATIVISSAESKSKISGNQNFEIIELVQDGILFNELPTSNLQTSIESTQLAYVIYTSGSTGKPKGVMIEHGNAYSFICWCRQEFASSNFDMVYAATSICFDLSVFEIFYPLSVGKRIRILENGLQIARYLPDDKRVLINSVPTVIQSLLKEKTDISNVSVLNMAGEPIPSAVLNQLNTDKLEVRNLYGPTEDTTYSTVYRLKNHSPLLIGKPISNTQIFIVNNEIELVPLGIAGEICIGGEGLSRGYLNRKELTAEKFIQNPFSSDPDARLYKTGDSGRWLPDGNIEYLGRLDDQVKIRGYRVELGEIESILHQSGLIHQAVVVARPDKTGTKRLLGYIIPKGNGNSNAIISYLKDRLPEFMVPQIWIELEKMPLTPNGKINKNALPEPGSKNESQIIEHTAPGNETELVLVEIWKKLLDSKEVGIHDNFFTLGGHSLLAVEVMSAIRKEFGVEIPLIDIFNSTIHSLAILINEQKKPTIAHLKSHLEAKTITLSQASDIAHRLEKGVLEWSSNGKGKYMIPIQKDGTKIPFFGIISFKSYLLLGNFMSSDQPLYYLPPTQSTSVEKIASHYVKEIKLLQPIGPYCIGGFCAGGMIALEIAQQLEAKGDKVLSLVLFEHYSPQAILPRKSLKYRKRKLSYYKERFISLYNSNKSRFELLKFVIKKSMTGFNIPFAKPFPKKQITTAEFNSYTFKPYSGNVKLFKASIPPIEVNDSPLMGWAEYFNGDVEVITVEGGHLGIFREPAVEKLAEELSAVLEEMNNGTQ